MGSWLARIAIGWLNKFRAHHDLKGGIPIISGAESKVLLHVGCGTAVMEHLPVSGFQQPEWRELRLDADLNVAPDIVATMTDMSAVPDDTADAVYSSHGIEHLYWHDVPTALAEFRRVLKQDGFAVITCPDVQAAAAMIAEDRMFDTAYESSAGAITPFDILYSYRPFVKENPQWMAHHCGFTLSTLLQVVRDAGFKSMFGFRRPGGFDLWVLASKSPRTPEELKAMAKDYLILSA